MCLNRITYIYFITKVTLFLFIPQKHKSLLEAKMLMCAMRIGMINEYLIQLKISNSYKSGVVKYFGLCSDTISTFIYLKRVLLSQR